MKSYQGIGNFSVFVILSDNLLNITSFSHVDGVNNVKSKNDNIVLRLVSNKIDGKLVINLHIFLNVFIVYCLPLYKST